MPTRENDTYVIKINFLIPCIISVIFLFAMSHRIYYLKSVAMHNKSKLSYSLYFRIISLLVELCLEFAIVFQSIFNDDFYSYRSGYVLCIIVTIITISNQIYLMIIEFKKNVPLFYMHKLYWILLQIAITICLILLLVEESVEVYNYILDILRFFNLIILNIYSLVIRKQDIYDFENQSFFSSQLPDVQDSYLQDFLRGKKMTRVSMTDDGNDRFLEIKINKNWSVIVKQEKPKIEVKMEVLFLSSGQSIKLKHTIDEFLTLSIAMQQECIEYFERIPSELTEIKSITQNIQESVSTQNTIPHLIKLIQKFTSRLEFATPTLFNFLEIPTQEVNFIQQLKNEKTQFVNREASVTEIGERKTSGPKNQRGNVKRSSEIITQNGQAEDKEPQNKWVKLPINSNYLEYFNIEFLNHTSIQQNSTTFVNYVIQIHFLLNDMKWNFEKRYTDFYELNETLKVFLNNRQIPEFPKKKIGSLDEKDLYEREYQLQQYLKILLNDRLYHHYALFKFIGLSKESEELVKKFQTTLRQDNQRLLDTKAISKGHEKITTEVKHYVRYIFSLERKDNSKIISKRFSEFNQLHQALKIRFPGISKECIMPDKVTPFGQKTSVAFRESLLTTYLNSLLQYPNIGESVFFRQFVEFKFVDIMKGNIEFIKSVENLDSVFQQLDNQNEEDESKIMKLSSRFSWD